MPRFRRKTDNQGFILITALWLLLLCGAVVALMMLRDRGNDERSRLAGSEAQERLDLASVVATVATDLLFRGNDSPWARTPSQGAVDLAGRRIVVAASSESGRLDLNDGDPAQIDGALLGLGVDADARAAFAAALDRYRSAHHRITRQATVDAMIGVIHADAAICIDDVVTIQSGQARPDEASMPSLLARALAVPQTAALQTAAAPLGAPIRLRLSTGGASKLLAVIRLSGTAGRPYEILRWTPSPRC